MGTPGRMDGSRTAGTEPQASGAGAPGAVAVGWIGLGEMGLPMAGQLVRAGHRVSGHDIREDRRAAARAAGIDVVGTLDELLAEAQVLISMLRTAGQTEALILGESGLVGAGASGVDVVVMSTMDPAAMQRLAERAAAQALTVLDVPVSGGVRGAEAATLSIMASGPPAALDRVSPLLEVMGSRVYRLGERAGMSQAVKLANQVMMAVAIAGTHEGLALVRDYGVGEPAAIEAIAAGTGSSWPLTHWDWMRSLWERYEPQNALDILDKDLHATVEFTRRRGLQMPVTEATFQMLDEMWSAARRDVGAGGGGGRPEVH